jgi:hypothetical protein
MRTLWLSICMALSLNGFASASEGICSEDSEDLLSKSGDSWAHLGDYSLGYTEDSRSLPSKTVPQLTFTAIEHDLPSLNKPASLFFTADNLDYRLVDKDGGATLAFLYGVCMSGMRLKLKGLDREAAKRRWKWQKYEWIEQAKYIKPLLINTLYRLRAMNPEVDKIGLEAILQELERRFKSIPKASNDPAEGITYQFMYGFLGDWLKENYHYFTDCFVLETNNKTGKGGRIDGIRSSDPGGHDYSPVGATLAHLCHLINFEEPLPFKKGVFELVLGCDLKTMMSAYETHMAADKGLPLLMRMTKRIETKAGGGFSIIEDWIPITENLKEDNVQKTPDRVEKGKKKKFSRKQNPASEKK